MIPPKNIVIRSPNWIGDHIMAAGAYRALAQVFPQARLTLVCPEALADIKYSAFFQNQITIANDARRKLTGSVQLAQRLRRLEFDAALLFTASFRQALPFFLAGISHRIGFRADGSRLLLTQSITWKGANSQRHKSSLYFDLVQSLSEKILVRWVEPVQPLAPERRDQIVIAPGASIALREWPHVTELITKLRQKHPSYKIILVGSKSELKWNERLAVVTDSAVENRIGQTSLSELTALCRLSKLVITNDSGIAHLAGSLAQASTLVLFGPGSPHYIQPIGPRVYPSRIELACSPCDKSYCRAPYGYQRCLQDLSADQVMEQVDSILTTPLV